MVRTDTPADGQATPANDVSLDYLQILLDELQARGLHYTPVMQSVNWDIEVPTALGFDLRHTDRIVTLIRTDEGSDLKVLDTDSGHFKTNCKLPIAVVGPIEIVRGWTSVDLRIRGKAVRFINTHLDGDCADPAIQLAQAREIIQGPVQDAREKDIPVILLGDLNSKADGTGTKTYAELLKPGSASSMPGPREAADRGSPAARMTISSIQSPYLATGGITSSSATGHSRSRTPGWSARIR